MTPAYIGGMGGLLLCILPISGIDLGDGNAQPWGGAWVQQFVEQRMAGLKRIDILVR